MKNPVISQGRIHGLRASVREWCVWVAYRFGYAGLFGMLLVVMFYLSEPAYAGSITYEKTTSQPTKNFQQGHRVYQINKGVAGESQYQEGERLRLQKNYNRAEDYFKRAARQGSGKAHFRLGQMYAMGRGSVRSLVEAHMHYNLASYLGMDDGRSAMLMLEDQMTEDQLERAMRRAVHYRQQNNL